MSERGYTATDDLFQWRKNIEDGKIDRRAGSIIILDQDGQSEVAPFDVVLLDWELGEGMSGLDVLKHIRERRAAGTDRCTVIIVSGNEPTPEERDAFLQTGADKYWVKPITAKQIQTLSLPASSA